MMGRACVVRRAIRRRLVVRELRVGGSVGWRSASEDRQKLPTREDNGGAFVYDKPPENNGGARRRMTLCPALAGARARVHVRASTNAHVIFVPRFDDSASDMRFCPIQQVQITRKTYQHRQISYLVPETASDKRFYSGSYMDRCLDGFLLDFVRLTGRTRLPGSRQQG